MLIIFQNVIYYYMIALVLQNIFWGFYFMILIRAGNAYKIIMIMS